MPTYYRSRRTPRRRYSRYGRKRLRTGRTNRYRSTKRYGRRGRSKYSARQNKIPMRGKIALPDSVLVECTWENIASVPTTATGVSDISFSYAGNNPLDPALANGTATTGSNWNFYAKYYEYYNVYACKINIEYLFSTDNCDLIISCIPRAKDDPQVDTYELTRVAPYVNQTRIFSDGGNNYARARAFIKHYMVSRKILAKTKSYYSDENTVPTDSQPNLPWYWDVVFSNPTRGNWTASMAYTIRLKLTYYVRFSKKDYSEFTYGTGVESTMQEDTEYKASIVDV